MALRPALALILLQLLLDGVEVHEELPAVLPLLDAPGGAQAEHQVLAAPLPLGDQVGLVNHRAPLQHAGDIALQVPHKGVAPAAEVGVGPRPEADVGPAHPVFQVVAGLEPRPGEVGDLILPVARRRQALHHPQVHVGLHIVVGQPGAPDHPVVQGGARLHLQAVAAQMLRLQGEHLLHRVLPAVHVLLRQAVDQIQAQVFQLGRPGGLHRLAGLLKGMGPVEALQLAVVGGLHPQGDAVDPRPAQGLEGLEIHTVRVALHGDLRVLGQIKALGDQPEQLLQALRPIKAGGSAAKIHRVHLPPPGEGGGLLHVGQQRLLIVVHPLLPPGKGVKVTVVTLAPAEGDVDVKAQFLRHRRHLVSMLQCSSVYYTTKSGV